MISGIKDYLLLKGRHPTEDMPRGDLQRITISGNCVRSGLYKRVMGEDIAWLQECMLERNYVLRVEESSIDTFSRFPNARLFEKLHGLVTGSFTENGPYVSTDDIVSSIEGVPDSETHFPFLLKIAKSKRLVVDNPTLPLPDESTKRAFHGGTVFSLENAMEDLSVVLLGGNVNQGIVECYSTPGEDIKSEGDEGALVPDHIIGEKDIYSERRAGLIDSTSDSFRQAAKSVSTAVVGGLGTPLYRFPQPGTIVRSFLKTTTVYALILFECHNTKPGGSNQRGYVVVKVSSAYVDTSINDSEIGSIIRRVKDFVNPDLDVSGKRQDDERLVLRRDSSFTITLIDVAVAATLRDEIVSWRQSA